MQSIQDTRASASPSCTTPSIPRAALDRFATLRLDALALTLFGAALVAAAVSIRRAEAGRPARSPGPV